MTDPSADRIELARLNEELGVLTQRLEQARQAWVVAHANLLATQQRRDEVAHRLLTAAHSTPLIPATTAASPVTAARTGDLVSPAPAATRETSTRTVQNALFILGGLLLGTAAVVFTAVAWTSYGVGGRALILAVMTILTLTAPLVALKLRLTATAETFAGIGLLLLLLDGYAAWYVNLFHVTAMAGTTYAAAVAAVTAVIAAGYRAATRLVGPGFAALVVAQPVVALLVTQWHPSTAGWAGAAATTAGLNLLVTRYGRRSAGGAEVGLRVVAWVFFTLALTAAACLALLAEAFAADQTDAAWAGLATMFVAAMLAGAAASTSTAPMHALAGCAMVFALQLAAGRLAAAMWPGQVLVAVAAVIATVVVLVSVVPMPVTVRPGVRAGAGVSTAGLALVIVGMVLTSAIATISDGLPRWNAVLDHDPLFTWQLLAALALTTAALVSLLPRWRGSTIAWALTLAVLALPGCVPLIWWVPAVIDLVAAVLLTLVAAGGTPARPRVALATGGAVLAAYAVAASLARPELTAAILTGLVVAGVAVAAVTRQRTNAAEPGDGAHAVSAAIGGVALAAGLLALPPAVGSWLVTMDVEPWWTLRLTVGSLGLLLAVIALVRRNHLAWYAFVATVVSAVIWPLVGAFSGLEPLGVYTGVGLLALAATVVVWGGPGSTSEPTQHGRSAPIVIAGGAAVPAALVLIADVAPAVIAVTVFPYGWLGFIWSGVPDGIGLAPPDWMGVAGVEVTSAHAVALALLAGACALAVYARTRRARAALSGLAVGAPTAVLVELTAAAAPWPTVTMVTLAFGLAMALLAAVAPIGRLRTSIMVTQGAAYLGAGITGSLTVRWSTLVALGSTVVITAVIGAVGRTVAARVAGWLAAAVATVATGAAAAFAADLHARDAGLVVLAAAALALAAGTALNRRGSHRPESVAVQAAAHAGAVVALVLTTGWPQQTAVICALWGIVVGLRALWPGTSATSRRWHAVTAAAAELLGWWTLLTARDVALVEAYTLPLAAVALLAGWVTWRTKSDIRSFVAFGPALVAAFAPTLATVLSGPGEGWRRLLLFAGALTIVIAGAVGRLKAPVIVGGITLILVALHELVLFWDLMPRWIPLAIGGLLLVSLAITYERQRRDVARIRRAVSQMR